jgi:hypothetical protein
MRRFYVCCSYSDIWSVLLRETLIVACSFDPQVVSKSNIHSKTPSRVTQTSDNIVNRIKHMTGAQRFGSLIRFSQQVEGMGQLDGASLSHWTLRETREDCNVHSNRQENLKPHLKLV